MLIRYVLILGLLLALQAVLVILFVPARVVVNAAQHEEFVLSRTLGDEAAERVTSRARETFLSWFVETGIMKESFDLLVPSETSKRRSSGLETLSEGAFEVVRKRLESAWNLVFVALQRVYAFVAWLPLFLPFMIAAVFDGATVRKVKLLTFGISSAPIFGVGVHMLVILLAFPLYFAVWPFSAPPLIVPIWFLSVALVLRLLIANLQRL